MLRLPWSGSRAARALGEGRQRSSSVLAPFVPGAQGTPQLTEGRGLGERGLSTVLHFEVPGAPKCRQPMFRTTPTPQSPGPTDPWTRSPRSQQRLKPKALSVLPGCIPGCNLAGGAHCPGRELRVFLAARLPATHLCPLRGPCSPPLYPPPPLPSSGPEPGHALSMIAQPVARILICIPRRPARPGHQPTFAPTPAGQTRRQGAC